VIVDTHTSLATLQSLCHHVVGFFGFLYLLRQNFLFCFLGSDELICVIDLSKDQSNSAAESGFDILFGLVDEHSSHLFEYLGV